MGSSDRSARGDTPLGMAMLAAVPLDPRSSGLTYELFYGLKEQPFSLSASPEYFYRSRSHASGFEDLRTAIERREGVMVATGDVGTGKTVLCRALAADLGRRAVTALVPNPAISREAFSKTLLVELGAAAPEDLSGRLHSLSEAELRHQLRGHLETLAQASTIALVIIDEAQSISADVVDEVNVLTEADHPLQVILAGQLELVERLAARDMRRLDQRAPARCTLTPLDRAGVAGYISYRLQKAGGSPDRIRFSDAAIDAVCERAKGVPRVINRLCDRALAAAHAQRVSIVEPHMVPSLDYSPAAAAAPPPSPAPEVPEPILASPAEKIDPIEAWIAGIEDGSVRPVAIPTVAPDADPADAIEPIPYAPPRGADAVVRIRIPRRSHRRRHRRLERRSDRWARRIANLLLALTVLLAGAMGGELLRLW